MIENIIGDPRCDICGKMAHFYLDYGDMLLCNECTLRVQDRAVGKIMSLTDDEILAMPSDKDLNNE